MVEFLGHFEGENMKQYLEELGLSTGMVDGLITWLASSGKQIVLAILLLIVGFWVIGKITRVVEALLGKRNFDPTVQKYLGQIIAVLMKVGLLISVAGMVGIETTSFIAILGAAGLAIGMALQGSLANFAGGVLILVFRPFKVGDYIVSTDAEGIVSSIDIFCTILTTLDNQRVILPNGPLAGGKIVNVGAEATRRVDLSIGIAYGEDFSKAQEVIKSMAKEDSRILPDPECFVGITGFGDSSVDLTVRVWCKTSDYWDVFFDTNKRLKEALDKASIEIPFPQREVRTLT